MEYVEGKDLSSQYARYIRPARSLNRKVVLAVEVLHQHQFCIATGKPQQPSRRRPTAQIARLGLALHTDYDFASPRWRIVARPNYFTGNKLRADPPTSTRDDGHFRGPFFYESLLDNWPFRASSRHQLKSIRTQRPRLTATRRLNPDIPGDRKNIASRLSKRKKNPGDNR